MQTTSEDAFFASSKPEIRRREEAAESRDAFVANERLYAWLQHTAATYRNPKIRRHAACSVESAQAQQAK